MQEQGRQLAVAGVIVGQKQRGVSGIDSQFLRSMHDGTDPVVVPGFAQTQGSLDPGNTGQLAGLAIFKRKDIAAVSQLQLTGE